MSDFHSPSDVLRQILLRLPAASLLRFRVVCKEWRSIIDDPTFVRDYINNHPFPNTLLIRNRTGAPIYSFSLDSLNFINGRQQIQSKQIKQLVRLNVARLTDLPVTSCDGLILLVHYNPQKIWAIWNPLTGDCRELPKPNADRLDIHDCGFGYDRTRDDYKVVTIEKLRPRVRQTRVYSLKTDSWRLIEDCPCGDLYMHSPSVFLNGSLHWLAGDRITTIIALDLGTEKYRHLPLPPHSVPYRCWSPVRLDALGGSLMLSYFEYMVERFDGWVMKDYEVQDSWVKLFSFKEPDIISVAARLRPVAYLKDKNQVFLQYDGGFFWFDVDSNSVKKVSVDGHPYISSSQICPGSLFHLSDGCGVSGKRKRNSKTADTRLTFFVRDIGSSTSLDSSRSSEGEN